MPAMTANELAAFLTASPVFAGVPAREVAALAAVAREESYRTRDWVFMEGEPADWFCLVRAGRVKILRASRGGKEVVLELLGPGEPFGGLTERHPSVIREMALMIGRRLRAAHESVRSLAGDPVEARLAAALLRLAERDGTRGPRGITLPYHLTRQSLADMTGTTVETTIRIVSRWQKDRLVADDNGRLLLADADGLRAIAEGEPD